LKIRDVKYSIKPDIENIITLSLNVSMFKRNLTDLINFVYLNLIQNISNINCMVSRTILILKNIDVEKILNIIINQLLSEAHV